MKRVIWTGVFFLTLIGMYAQQGGTKEPEWVRKRPQGDGVFEQYYVGKSEPRGNYQNYQEAQGSALMDVLTQYMLYQGGEAKSMATDYTQGSDSFQEDVSRIAFTGRVVYLYRRGEWIAGDGTLYVLYSTGELRSVPPQVGALFPNHPLQKNKMYFVGSALSPDSRQASAQAGEDGKLQALLWLEGSLTGTFEGYNKSEGKTNIESFSAAVKCTSGINLQSLSFQEETRSIQPEQDQYRCYVLYSINAGKPKTGAEQEYFSYQLQHSKSPGKQSFSKQIRVNGARFTQNQPYKAPRAGKDTNPPWANDVPPDNVIWGIGIAENPSTDAMNLMSATRAVISIGITLDSMAKDYNSAGPSFTEDVTRQVISFSTMGVTKNTESRTGNNVIWQRWELSKASIVDEKKAQEMMDKLDNLLNKLGN